jgi:hypothetical protein
MASWSARSLVGVVILTFASALARLTYLSGDSGALGSTTATTTATTMATNFASPGALTTLAFAGSFQIVGVF